MKKSHIGYYSGFGGFCFVLFVIFSVMANITIYDNFSGKNYRWTSYNPGEIQFRNNSPFLAATFVSLLQGEVKVINGTGKVDCFVTNSLKGNTPCDQVLLDFGKVESGQSGNLMFTLDPHNNNFTIKATPYLHVFGNIKLSSRSWQCIRTLGDFGDDYFCS